MERAKVEAQEKMPVNSVYKEYWMEHDPAIALSTTKPSRKMAKISQHSPDVVVHAQVIHLFR